MAGMKEKAAHKQTLKPQGLLQRFSEQLGHVRRKIRSTNVEARKQIQMTELFKWNPSHFSDALDFMFVLVLDFDTRISNFARPRSET